MLGTSGGRQEVLKKITPLSEQDKIVGVAQPIWGPSRGFDRDFASLLCIFKTVWRICTLLPGGFGKTPGRHDDRSATMLAGLGQAEAGNARLLATSQEVRLELSGGVRSLPQVPRRSAGRRARPERLQAATPAGAARERCDHIAPISAPPPFFRLAELGDEKLGNEGAANHSKQSPSGRWF
jgi:hypothetical protein